MTYRIDPLPLTVARPLFALSDTELVAIGARRMVADTPNSAPCRISLVDAAPGESLILFPHAHLTDPASPYRAGGPVFVREAAEQADPVIDAVPGMLSRRLLSMRLYDADWMMIEADVVEGADLDRRLSQGFRDPSVSTIHLHTARRGCFMAAARRA
jgi:hypothetical protein